MKKRGFMFVELLLVGGIFTGIIFPLIMLMNKNIERITDFKREHDLKRVTENLENIFLDRDMEIMEIEGKYFLFPSENQKESFVLKDETGKELITMRNLKYIPKENRITVSKRKVFSGEEGNKEEITEIYILDISFKNKNIKRILK